jgi:diacylglycerol kinase family enzyme
VTGPLPAARERGPLLLVMNEGSGDDDKAELRSELEAALRASGRPFVLRVAQRGSQLPQLAADAVAQAVDERGSVVAIGGDGTLNTVAQAVLPSGRPFGVLPRGTFNYFAREHGLPLAPAEAAAVWLEGRVREVQVGQVNGQAFLVNASLGIYPRLLQAREEDNRQFGRHRIVALWAALRTLWRERRTLKLGLSFDGGPLRAVRTPTLFVGNNALQLRQLGLPEAEAVQHEGRLAAIVVPRVGRWEMLKLMARAAAGQLEGGGPRDGVVDVHSTSFRQLLATPRRRASPRPVQVAYDGELRWLQAPLEFAVAPQRLRLLVPAVPPEGGG